MDCCGVGGIEDITQQFDVSCQYFDNTLSATMQCCGAQNGTIAVFVMVCVCVDTP